MPTFIIIFFSSSRRQLERPLVALLEVVHALQERVEAASRHQDRTTNEPRGETFIFFAQIHTRSRILTL